MFDSNITFVLKEMFKLVIEKDVIVPLSSSGAGVGACERLPPWHV